MPDKQSVTTIEREFEHGVFRWRFVCTCGIVGEYHFKAQPAERDCEQHARVNNHARIGNAG